MIPPQKIGVLTFHRCINYGSYWQARCLVEGLRARGHDAVLLYHHSPRVHFREWKCALQPTLPTPVPRADRALYRRKMEQFFCAFERLPLSPPFDLDNPAAMEDYETIVIGSDEVWNLCHPWYGGSTPFFGEGLKAKRLVSYAASFGHYDAWGGLEERWANRLRAFDAIAVRDENSRAIIENALGFSPPLTLDPCLQFPISLEGEWRGPRTPFVALYGHNFSEWFAREVRRAARARSLPIISIGYRNDWADEQWLDAGPHDFAHFMARAQAVATNFFHGCVFALRNEKPFVCETSPYRWHKVRGLLMKLGGEARGADERMPSAEYDALLQSPIAPAILGNIAQLRRASQQYLDAALMDGERSV